MEMLYMWITILLSALFATLGDFHGKLWAQSNRRIFLAMAFAIYMIDQTFFSLSLLSGILAKNIFIAFLLAMLIDVCIGTFYFKEKMNKTNIIGLILGVMALVLLNI